MLKGAYKQSYALTPGEEYQNTFKFDEIEDYEIAESTEETLVIEEDTVEYISDAVQQISGSYELTHIKVTAAGAFVPPPDPSEKDRQAQLLLELEEAQKEREKMRQYNVRLAAAQKRYVKLKALEKQRARIVMRFKNVAYLGFKQFALKGVMILVGPSAIAWLFSSGALFSVGSLNPFWKTVLFSGLESFGGLSPMQSQTILKALDDLAKVVPNSEDAVQLFAKAFGGKNPFLEAISFETLAAARSVGGDKINTEIANYQEKMFKVIQSLIGARLPLNDIVGANAVLDMWSKTGPTPDELEAAEAAAKSPAISSPFRFILSSSFPRTYKLIEDKIGVLNLASSGDKLMAKEKSRLEKILDYAEKTPNWFPVDIGMLKTIVKIQNGIETAFEGKSVISAAFEAYNTCEFEIDNVIGLFSDPKYEKSNFLGTNMGASVDSFFNNVIMRETVKGLIGEKVFNAASMVFSKEKLNEILNSKNGIPLFFGTLTPASFLGYMNNAFYSSVSGTISSGIKDMFIKKIWPHNESEEETATRLKEESERKKAFQETMVNYSIKLVREGKRGKSFESALEEYRLLNAPPELINVEDLTTYQKIMREFNTQIKEVKRSTDFKSMIMYGTILGGSAGINMLLQNFNGEIVSQWDLLRVLCSGHLNMAIDFSKGMGERTINKALRQLQMSIIELYNTTYKALIRDHVQSYFKPVYEYKERKMAKFARWMENRIGNSLVVRFLFSPALTMILNFFLSMPSESLDTFFQQKLRESSLGMGLTAHEAKMNPLTLDSIMRRFDKIMNTNALDVAAISKFAPKMTPGDILNFGNFVNLRVVALTQEQDRELSSREKAGLATDPTKAFLTALAPSEKVEKIGALVFYGPNGITFRTNDPDIIKQYVKINLIELALRNPDIKLGDLIEKYFKAYGFTEGDVSTDINTAKKKEITPDDYRDNAEKELSQKLFKKTVGQSFNIKDENYKISHSEKGAACDFSIPYNIILKQFNLCIVKGKKDLSKEAKTLHSIEHIFKDNPVLNIGTFESITGDYKVFDPTSDKTITATQFGNFFSAVNALRKLASTDFSLTDDIYKEIAKSEDAQKGLSHLEKSLNIALDADDELKEVLKDGANSAAYSDFKEGKTTTIPSDLWYAHRAKTLAENDYTASLLKFSRLMGDNPELSKMLEKQVRDNLERSKQEIKGVRDKLMFDQVTQKNALVEIGALTNPSSPDNDDFRKYVNALINATGKSAPNDLINDLNRILEEFHKDHSDIYSLMSLHFRANQMLAKGYGSSLPPDFAKKHQYYVNAAKNRLNKSIRKAKVNATNVSREKKAFEQLKSDALKEIGGNIIKQGGQIDKDGKASGCEIPFAHLCISYNSIVDLRVDFTIPEPPPKATASDAESWSAASAYISSVDAYNSKEQNISELIADAHSSLNKLVSSAAVKRGQIEEYLKIHDVGQKLPAISELPAKPAAALPAGFDDITAVANAHSKAMDGKRAQLISMKDMLGKMAVDIKGIDSSIAKERKDLEKLSLAPKRSKLAAEYSILLKSYNDAIQDYNNDTRKLALLQENALDNIKQQFISAYDPAKIDNFIDILENTQDKDLPVDIKATIRTQLGNIKSIKDAYNMIFLGDKTPFDPSIYERYMKIDDALKPTLLKLGSALVGDAKKIDVLLSVLKGAGEKAFLSSQESLLYDFVQDDSVKGAMILGLSNTEFNMFADEFPKLIPSFNDDASAKQLADSIAKLTVIINDANNKILTNYKDSLERTNRIRELLKGVDFFSEGTESQNSPFTSLLKTITADIEKELDEDKRDDLNYLRGFVDYSRGILIKSGGNTAQFLEDVEKARAGVEPDSLSWRFLKSCIVIVVSRIIIA